ncbi:MAG: SH3 domain-containing protein [Gammaproteobacteria bacterium]|nr:SH3 domain-containing protein [Gammaproteobacteria bacterium]
MMKKIVPPLLTLLLLGFHPSGSASDVYLQSLQGRLYSQPAFNATMIDELQKGAVMQLISQQKSWSEVRYQNKEGWISSYLIKATPPTKPVSLLTGEESESISDSARRRASVVTTAGAARGLAASERRARLGDDIRRSYLQLRKIERFSLGEEELNHFLATQDSAREERP